MADGTVPVTIDIDGEKVVIGSAKLIQKPNDKYGETTVAVTLDLDSIEGTKVYSAITNGLTDSLSIDPNDVYTMKKTGEA